MDDLPPLNVPKKPVGIVSPTGFVKLEPEATPEKDEDTSKLPNKDVAYLTRNTRKIIQVCRFAFQIPKAIELINFVEKGNIYLYSLTSKLFITLTIL